MYQSVSVDHKNMAAHLTRCDCEGFCISNGMDETDDEMLWNGSEEDGNVKSWCEEDEGTDCEDGDSDNDWSRQIESDMLGVLSVCN